MISLRSGSSWMVSTLASHARGPGFKPRASQILFLKKTRLCWQILPKWLLKSSADSQILRRRTLERILAWILHLSHSKKLLQSKTLGQSNVHCRYIRLNLFAITDLYSLRVRLAMIELFTLFISAIYQSSTLSKCSKEIANQIH